MDKALKQQKENEETAPKARSALSTLSTRRGRSGGLSQRGGQQQQQQQQQQGGEKAGEVGWFQIYEEGEDENGEKKGRSNEQFKGSKELAYLWGDLASEREKDKENNMVPSTWSGLKV